MSVQNVSYFIEKEDSAALIMEIKKGLNFQHMEFDFLTHLAEDEPRSPTGVPSSAPLSGNINYTAIFAGVGGSVFLVGAICAAIWISKRRKNNSMIKSTSPVGSSSLSPSFLNAKSKTTNKSFPML
jgi:hypothetical protein